MGSAMDVTICSAMGATSAGSVAATPGSHAASSSSVIAVASARLMPRTCGSLAAAERRVPWQSGHGPSRRNLATRFMPFSSFTRVSAFSTE